MCYAGCGCSKKEFFASEFESGAFLKTCAFQRFCSDTGRHLRTANIADLPPAYHNPQLDEGVGCCLIEGARAFDLNTRDES